VRITGPNPRLPQDGRPPQDTRAARGNRATADPRTMPDSRTTPDPRTTRNLRTPRAAGGRGDAGAPGGPGTPGDPGSASGPRGPRPPRRPPRPPRWLTIRRGDPGRRVGISLLAIAVTLTLFAGRLVQIQGLDSASYKADAKLLLLRKIALPALRGTVYSSDHQILAMTTEKYQVWADPHPSLMTAAELPTVAQQLSGPLGLPAAEILSKLQHPTSPKYVVLATGVSVANDQKIEALSAYDNGIYDTASYAMAYPDGEATANVVGFTNVNPQTGVIVGQAGVEQEYNKLLTGTTGSEQYEKGIDGQQIPGSLEETPAQNGDSIKLTINSVLQYDAMKACEQEVDKSQAKSCTAVIMQPKTGDILAMAQWPTWDQNTDVSDATDIPDQWQFTPGSTAKVITAAAAFEHGGKTPMSSYYIPYEIYRGGQWIHDAEWSPNEHYTIAGIIANSSNIGMSQVVQSVTQQTQYDYLRNFGLDEPTGLGLPNETQGQLDPPSKWAGDERYTLAYGQGIAVNAIQMASVYATIANNGVRVAPRLVEGTYNAAGQYTPAAPSTSRRVIQPKTAKELIPILQQVPGIDETADQPWGIIPGYAVASKTGTANEPASSVDGASCPAGNPLCIYGASYIGMAPGNGPQVVVAVNVQDPNKSHQDYFGDMVAGPVFYNVMKDAIAELGIQPQPGLVPPDVRLNAP
jgi:cell division protein FtsI (penicillin-binding protein 3)